MERYKKSIKEYKRMFNLFFISLLMLVFLCLSVLSLHLGVYQAAGLFAGIGIVCYIESAQYLPESYFEGEKNER